MVKTKTAVQANLHVAHRHDCRHYDVDVTFGVRSFWIERLVMLRSKVIGPYGRNGEV